MKKSKSKINWKILILSFIVVYGIAFIGSLFTTSSVNSEWYLSIKPSITPPNWVFPIAWNILFFLIAVSLYLVILNKNKKNNKKAVTAFVVNLILNALWTLFYFKMQNPLFAFYEIILLWVSILLMIVYSYKVNKTSAYLLIPYLLWVSFATVLNYLSAF
mgnify:CR=1 FL=1